MDVTDAQLKHIFLQQRQGLPLPVKIKMAHRRIREWYDSLGGNVYVSFSGGKDSYLLLHLVRMVYPSVPAVFVDTGLEFPEIREFVRSVDNVIWLKPKYTFKQVTERWGYPVVSKKVAMSINRYQTTKSDVQRSLRLAPGINPNTGRMQTTGIIPKKYQYLVDAPFKISEYCCNALKKSPLERFEKKTGSNPFIGTMASDSKTRRDEVVKNGCNAFSACKPVSRPLSFFTEDDVLRCTKLLPHSRIYDMGYTRTGCMFCLFGVQEEMRKTGQNRFQLMKKTHPRLWEKALPAFGIDKVMEFMGMPIE